jgi:hypothetical protein
LQQEKYTMKSPDGRRIFVWHGKNPAEDANRLTNAVAEAAIAELFELNGGLFWLDKGRLVPANKDVLRNIIARHIVAVRLVDHGGDKWESEFYPFEFPVTADVSKQPNERVLIDMTAALLERVAKGPSEPRRLSPQQQREVRARLAMGEAKDRIANAYGVPVDTIASGR